MPLNFGAVMKRIIGKAARSGAISPEQLCLSEHTSKWNMNVYLAVAKEYEPVLLLPIGFGCILANIPLAGMSDGATTMHWTPMAVSWRWRA